jgi:dTDP-4-amino-4,6-dideoxygalactose transaminase
MEAKFDHHDVGLNSRLDAFEAAVLRVKLRHLDVWTARRRAVAANYQTLFAARDSKHVTLPVEKPGNVHVYNQYVIRVPAPIRGALGEYLKARQIGTEIYYPIPLHLQRCFAALAHKPGDFPHSESAADETIALPIYPELTDEQQRFVVSSISQFLEMHAAGLISTGEKAA